MVRAKGVTILQPVRRGKVSVGAGSSSIFRMFSAAALVFDRASDPTKRR
jgi:hypothetical protein